MKVRKQIIRGEKTGAIAIARVWVKPKLEPISPKADQVTRATKGKPARLRRAKR
jgi:hypothetical protein